MSKTDVVRPYQTKVQFLNGFHDDIQLCVPDLRCCRAVDDKVWAIIGPSTSSDVEAVQYMATSLRVPQVAPIATYPGFDDRPSMGYLVRMSPSDKWQSRVLADIFQRFHWSYAAIIVSNTDYGIYVTTFIRYT
ncbi:uncharacterized protein TRIADDRAFT_51777 [Trichoplax adhaerens]|uniref:Receptor ligand binding region domain-containing protein n=1 Tax=Trichoplax adhaerens TaxID=10228 RepID=B3RKV2_TRIAD|nr:hypothetical protein TRIADDRAFT_51777 [Trichoplax adhaerens]EDV29438.1 hypothetical protein TRIADDRAFT_51777 [Trichoplax adhaerens]|eukprot:XP_002108640.1 hypothetical protein TRIADDRAFT_51777 [Trichoplax adhaerens]